MLSFILLVVLCAADSDKTAVVFSSFAYALKVGTAISSATVTSNAVILVNFLFIMFSN